MGDFSSLPVSCNRLLVTWCRIVEGVGRGGIYQGFLEVFRFSDCSLSLGQTLYA